MRRRPRSDQGSADEPDSTQEKRSLKQSQKTILLWLLFLLIFFSIWKIMTESGPEEGEITYNVFQDAVEAGAIAEVTIKPNDEISGRFTTEGAQRFGEGQEEFATSGPTQDLVDTLYVTGARIAYETETGGVWQPLLITWLPLLFLFLIFFFFMRQIQSSGGKAMSFGKSRAHLLNESQKKVTFEDIAGVQEAKEELQEIIEFLRDPRRFTRLGGRIPKGVLMLGPPGTGKTLLARGVAGEAGVPFFSIAGSDFVEMFVGVGASRVRDLFEQGKKHAPCIIFIDEIDAVGRHRGAGMGGGHDEREQTLNQLLVEMDGFDGNDGVILIAATNRPDVLDPALLRPGRFDRRVFVPRPDVGGRYGILEVHTRKTPLASDVNLQVIARGTPGFSGADLENLVNEAALLAARAGKTTIEMEDLEEAKDKVMMGVERKSAKISEKDRRVTAYHEAGHALVAKMLPEDNDVDPVHKVTIIPRGQALGLMQQIPAEDRQNITREWAEAKIAIAMGGRIAEQVVFDRITAGAAQDIQMASDIARKMVCEWGMSDSLGPLAYGRRDENPFLGKEFGGVGQRDFSEDTAIRIDAEARRIVTEQYDRAKFILEENKDTLEAIAEALLEYEVLDSDEIDVLIRKDDLGAYRSEKESERENMRSTRAPKSGFTTQLPQEEEKKPSVLKPAVATGD
ncbi:MAG: ATP-dependent zinc metalloprotease FtsH [Myxococcales bacterium]|nr:ATP-dependent zinc metalloprotease FtsH [Myxococcales bacterium]